MNTWQWRLTSAGKHLVGGLPQSGEMPHRLPRAVYDRLDPPGLTPGMIVAAARWCVPVAAGWTIQVRLAGGVTTADAAQGALILGVAALLAAPRRRAAELLGMVAIWLTLGEFLAASRTGQFVLWRWAVALAALGLIVVFTRVQQVRALARANRWRPLREHVRAHRAGGVQATAASIPIEGRARRIAS